MLKTFRLIRVFICIITAVIITGQLLPYPVHASEYSYILIEAETGTVLEEHNAYTQRNAGYMAKLMTLLIAAEDIETGKYSLQTEIKAPQAVNGLKGSVVWLEPGDSMTAEELLKSGAAMEKFEQMVTAQGGSLKLAMAQAQYQHEVLANESGVVQSITARDIGHASMLLGAGRETKASAIDLSAGIVLKKKVGDTVQQGEPLAVLYYNDAYAHRVQDAADELQQAYTIGDADAQKEPLIWKIISE